MRQNHKILRSEQTEAESKLWYFLRAKRLVEFKFKRQQPIGPYIVDFVCIRKKLVIELDGGQNAESKNRCYDKIRTEFLESKGFKVIRFLEQGCFFRNCRCD